MPVEMTHYHGRQKFDSFVMVCYDLFKACISSLPTGREFRHVFDLTSSAFVPRPVWGW